MTAPGALVHLVADFADVPDAQLRDATMLSGLLIAAAGAAGLQASGLPIVHVRPDGGVSAVLMLEECHLIVHAHPARRMLLLDLLAPATKDWSRVLEVFTRRIPASAVHQDVRHRAGAVTDKGVTH